MRTRERIVAVCVTVAVAGSLAMLGSAPRWAACVAAFAAAACALPLLTSRRAGSYRSPLLWLLAFASLFTALQLVPWPAALVEMLAPARHALELDNATAMGTRPAAFLPFTYDLSATWLELAKLLGYLVFALACTGLASSAAGRAWIARTVVGVAVATALCALAHHILGLRSLFMLYTPEARPSSFVAPLLNENHLSGFLAMATPLAIGLAMANPGARRLGWGLGALLCGAVALLVQSRTGAIALVVGVVLLGALSLRRRQLEQRGRIQDRSRLQLAKVVPAGIVVSCVVVLLATFAASGVRDELAATTADEMRLSESKVGVWRASAELARDNTWTGIGRGAFEFAFTRVHHSGLKTHSHVENEYLQALLDWGLPATAVLALFWLWLGMAMVRNWRRSPIEVGALAALCTLALHSGADFAAELPGVAFSAIAVASVLLSTRLDKVPKSRVRVLAAGRLSLITAAIAVTAVAASPIADSARSESLALSDLMAATDISDERVIAAGKQAFIRHPSDYLAAAQLAQAYFYRARDPRAIALMNRALALNPKHPGLHVFTAKMLRAGQRDEQALIEFALALRYTLEPEAVLRELMRAFPEASDAARGIPVGRERAPIMANRLTTMERADVGLAYLVRATEELPSEYDIANLVTEMALGQGALDTALAHGERAYRERGWLRDALWYGRALQRAGRLSEAVVVAETAIGTGEAQGLAVDLAIYEVYADGLVRTGQAGKARTAIRTAIDLAVGDARALTRLYNLLARAEQALGHPREAQDARRRSHEYASQL